MIIIEKPTVTLVAKSRATYDAEQLTPHHESNSEIIAAVGGKVCYDAHGRDGNPVDKHIQRLVQAKHYSVLEHVVYSFLITGISRGLSHELVRHRHLSFSQRSTRYTEEGDERIVLEPRALKWREKDYEGFDAYYMEPIREAFNGYKNCVKHFTNTAPEHDSKTEMRKYARGAARQLLPHCLETQMVVTGNMRTWREILLLRTSRHAEAEIRRLFHEIWLFFVSENETANIFSDFEVGSVDGFVELTIKDV